MNAIINGFEQVDALDVENTTEIAHGQMLMIMALFRSIARLTGDKDIQVLCRHGAEQLDMVANDIDVLRERATKAGLVGGAV